MRKTAIQLTGGLMAMLLLLGACAKGGDPDPKLDGTNTYFKFSLSGARENGVFAVEADPNDLKSVQHMVVSTPSVKTGTINVLGTADDVSHATIKFPVKKGLFELLEANSSNFILSIHVNGRLYSSKSVSVHITDLVESTNPMQLSLVKGKFEGVMKHFYTEDRIEKEEAYTIHGDFQYLSPSYYRQLNKK